MALQVVDLSFDAAAPSGANVLRLVELSLDVGGNAPTLTGSVSSNATTPAGSPVPAGTQVTMSVNISGAYTSTTWTVMPGSPSVNLAGSSTSRTFTAPYTTDLGDVIIGVTATGPGGTSAQLVLTVTVLPHMEWYLSGSTWAPITDSGPL